MTTVRAIRGATTVDSDSPEQITHRVQELVAEMLEQNEVHVDDFISIMFTATHDIKSMFPATAARLAGLEDVPLFGAQELDVEKSLPFCIRLIAHINTDLERKDINHIYLHEAKRLRVDLVK